MSKTHPERARGGAEGLLTVGEVAERLDGPPHGKVWLTIEDLARRWGVSPTHAYNESRRAGFPKPDIANEQITIWLKPDILEYEKTRANEVMDYCLYRHFGADGRLLYVGQSLSVLTRTSGHRRFAGWFRDIATIRLERLPTKAALDEAERTAIRNEGPLHNKAHVPKPR